MVEKPWPVWDVVFSPDGRLLAVGRGHRLFAQGGEGEVTVWVVEDWKHKSGFTASFTDYVGGVAFTADGKSVIAAADKYFPPAPETPNQSVAGGKSINAEAPLWDGNVVFIWTVPDGKLVQTLNYNDFRDIPNRGAGSVSSLALSPDGELVGLARSGSIPAILQQKTGRSAYELAGHAGNSHGLAFSPNGKTLVSITHMKPLVRLYDAANGKELAGFDLKCAPSHVVMGQSGGYEEMGDSLTCVRFSPDGKQIAVGVSEGSVRLLNADLTKQLRSLKASDDKERVVSLGYASKADLLATATPSNIRLFEASSGKQLHEWGKADLMASSVALSPDGKLLAVGYGGKHNTKGELRGGFVNIWDTKTGRLVKKLE